MSRPREARSVARRKETVFWRKDSTLAMRCVREGGCVSWGFWDRGKRRREEGGLSGGFYLLLRHAAVELGGFEAEEAEDDADAVDFAFLAEEDDDFVGVDAFAEEEEIGESFVFSSGTESDELLD